MAKFKFAGVDEYVKRLNRLASYDQNRKILGEAIFDGAKIVADAVRGNIGSIPEIDHRKHGSDAEKLGGITSAQKQGLLEGFGIAPMSDDDDFLNVKLGFDGYNSVKTEKYPSGQPNALIARSVNSGTSFRAKIPFVGNAVRATKAKAEKAIEKGIDKGIEELFKGG